MAGTLEASEVFAAASMFFTKTELQRAVRPFRSLGRERSGVVNLTQNFFPEAKEKAEAGIVFGERRGDWLRKFDEIDSYVNWANVADMVRGISAAIAIKEWLAKPEPYGMGVKGSDPIAKTVYLTGSTWPSPVDKLNIDVDGFKAYNSSDIIITVEDHSYYGVSLKKKPTQDSADPTMINKAFDTVIQGTTFKHVRDELEQVREDYFAGIVQAAVDAGHIYLPIPTTNNDFNKTGLTRNGVRVTRTSRTNAGLFKPTTKARTDYNFAHKRIFIDTKGSLHLPEIIGPKDEPDDTANWGKSKQGNTWNDYGDTALNKGTLKSRPGTMRKFVNGELANQKLYDNFMNVMNKKKNIDLFATQLIKVTLRTDILKELRKSTGLRELGALKIGFALVTGIGGASTSARKLWDSNGDITMYNGKAYDIDCVMKGLTHLSHGKTSADNYQFKITNKFEEEGDMDAGSGAAKVKFDLIKKGKPLMHMELRYKGGFGGQPQFFGYMTQDFKDVLAGQCI